MKFLVEYDWPGNVRELENIIERAIVLSNDTMINPEYLPFGIQGIKLRLPTEALRTKDELKKAKRQLQRQVTDKVEKSFLLSTLERNQWNISKCAKETGIDRANFHALMRKHSIKRPRHQ
jgi:DNA-binding NtrC family response regulator